VVDFLVISDFSDDQMRFYYRIKINCRFFPKFEKIRKIRPKFIFRLTLSPPCRHGHRGLLHPTTDAVIDDKPTNTIVGSCHGNI